MSERAAVGAVLTAAAVPTDRVRRRDHLDGASAPAQPRPRHARPRILSYRGEVSTIWRTSEALLVSS